MPRPRRIEAYAIVSTDGMLANAAGIMPEALKLDADQKFFAQGLDGVEAVAHGRHSHEQQPHSHLRHRLIVTRHVPALAPDPSNPQGAVLESGRRFARASLGGARDAGRQPGGDRRHRCVRAVPAGLRRLPPDAGARTWRCRAAGRCFRKCRGSRPSRCWRKAASRPMRRRCWMRQAA